MSLHPRPRRHRRTTLLLALACVLIAPVLARAYTPAPSTDVTVIPVGGKDYVLLGSQPVVIPLLGPGTLSGYARVGFAPGEEGSKSGVLQFDGVNERTIKIPLSFTPSSKSTWDDGSAGLPSGGRKFEVYVPSGVHNVAVTGLLPAGGFLTARFQYDGPGQDKIAAAKAGKKKKTPWRYRNQFGLEVIYDDNVITQGDEGIDSYIVGVTPEQFRIGSIDDLLFAPWLDFAAERKFWDIGKTRFRFKVKRWMYTQNPIKTNTDLHWYVRQYFGRNKNLEAYYHYAPEQYIRLLGDRPPYSDPGEDVVYKPFKFTRNVANLNWRHTVSKKFSYQLLVEYNGRFYNKPFIENDIQAWEIRGQVAYRVVKKLKLSFDYSYEDGKARAMDTEGETPETSDDGDGSYLRDLYRFGINLKTKWALPVFDTIDASYLFMDYYFPTFKFLFDDPFHVGRRDKVQKVTVKLVRRINKKMSVYGSFRYADRVVESPWYGDITLDKDYIQHRYWVGMTYKF